MGCRSEGEQGDGGPVVPVEPCVGDGHEDDGKDEQGAGEHGSLASVVDAGAALHEEAGEPAAGDGAEAGGEVDDDDGQTEVLEVETVVFVEVLRQPEEIEPPDGIGESLALGEGPEAAGADELAEEGEESLAFFDGDDGFEVLLGEGGAAAELVVGEDEPDDEPEEAHRAGGQKGGSPVVVAEDDGDEPGDDDGADVRTGVEDAGGEGALLGGEPLGDGLDGGGEVAGFAEAEHEAGDVEADDRGDEGVAHGGERPDADGESVSQLGAELVDQASGGQQADAVCDLEVDENVAEVVIEDGVVGIGRVPAHEGDLAQARLDEREDIAVHVVDGCRGEEKGADEPPDGGLVGG